MGGDWLQNKCKKCGGIVFYLSQWRALPSYCESCRLSEIEDLCGLLEKFLSGEAKIRKRCRTLQDKQLFADREPLRLKVMNALAKSGRNARQLAVTCKHDRELLRLVFRIARDQRLEHQSPHENKRILPKSFAPFLQGGAPGLGKR